MKLDKEKKVVRLPRCSKSVKDTLERAMKRAINQKWKKVVVVAIDIDNDYIQLSSNISNTFVIGMLDVGKDMVHRDMYE